MDYKNRVEPRRGAKARRAGVSWFTGGIVAGACVLALVWFKLAPHHPQEVANPPPAAGSAASAETKNPAPAAPVAPNFEFEYANMLRTMAVPVPEVDPEPPSRRVPLLPAPAADTSAPGLALLPTPATAPTELKPALPLPAPVPVPVPVNPVKPPVAKLVLPTAPVPLPVKPLAPPSVVTKLLPPPLAPVKVPTSVPFPVKPIPTVVEKKTAPLPPKQMPAPVAKVAPPVPVEPKLPTPAVLAKLAPPPPPVHRVEPPPPVVKPSAPSSSSERDSYVLQLGSFRESNDVENLKARLGFLGVETRVQKVTLDNNETFHRLRAGPFHNQQELDEVRRLLNQNNIKSVIMKWKG